MSEERRRTFLLGATVLMAGGAAWADAPPKASAKRPSTENEKKKGDGDDEDVAPPEDLMREHGVLNRILLLYEEGVRRLEAQRPLPIETVASAADIVRRFIEQYHEKLEEDHLFPRFEKAHKLVDLVATLRRQHQAGRGLTESILKHASVAGVQAAADRQKLTEAMRLFVRMYRPHEAREDTVLFPALRSIVPRREFEALGEAFEEKEHQLFGKEGFEGIVEQVGKLERALGIYELDQFTPSL
ncbi:MAG TPA: hemerythrin domain-containing protein [Polyangia bacterium]|jgi:hemerythrin-like domain-containing protein|nr:hemerythrin domain-containing protein [Polyangia bacterium]